VKITELEKRLKFCHFLYKSLNILVVSESDIDEVNESILESLHKYGYALIEMKEIHFIFKIDNEEILILKIFFFS